jgi:2-keto-myo-inositol isomerase
MTMADNMNRRAFLQSTSTAGVGIAALSPFGGKKKYQSGASEWPICLNHSTIRPTPFEEKIRIAAEAGYDAIEPWINELEEYEKKGGDLKALGKEIRDRGLYIPNVIGLWNCMPAGQEAWEKSLPATRNRMRMAAAVGSEHVAAIPTPDSADFDIKWGAKCYAELMRMGRDEYGITPAFEFVGFLKGVHRLGQACACAIDANVPEACLVMDTFHLSRGGSGFEGIRHLQGSFIATFHWNDVPADPAPETQADEHRIYPGDGILPLTSVVQQLREIDYTGPLSIEMFNRKHWEQDPKVVVETALKKTLAVIAAA